MQSQTDFAISVLIDMTAQKTSYQIEQALPKAPKSLP